MAGIHNMRNMKLNRTDKDESNEVVFIGCKYKRIIGNGSIVYKWFKQPSLQVLNLHLNHPQKGKINITNELAKLALTTTSPIFRNDTNRLLQTNFENRNSTIFKRSIDEQLKKFNGKQIIYEI